MNRIALVASLFACTSPCWAQTFPTGPLTLIVPFAPGGGTDFIGRVLSEQLTTQLGQRVIVDNRGGAGTVIGTNAVAKAKPDGQTMLVNGASMAFFPALFKDLPFDPAKDLRIVTLVSEQPYVLTVTQSFAPKTVKDFIALAKARPGEISYVSAGIGSGTHLASELLWQALGVKLLHIPYKGTAPAVADLAAGYVQVMYTTAAGATGMIKSGRIRALGVSSAKRISSMPQVPTIAESGVKNFKQVSWIALFVPSATPQATQEKLRSAAVAGLSSADVKAKFETQGLEPASSASLDEAQRFYQKEAVRWAGVIKATGIKPQ
ncbi:MAG TPA: tripartite tricarboxylate transporter substrate binding protein [Burkholderiales bacterium]|nr:tripartite tricarboxylate transporter substrate binding protein [Burkholderiales bacterium]